MRETLSKRGVEKPPAKAKKPVCVSSRLRVRLFMDTLLPPMLAPVMTVAPRSRVMDTEVKAVPRSFRWSATSGCTMSTASTRGLSTISGRQQ